MAGPRRESSLYLRAVTIARRLLAGIARGRPAPRAAQGAVLFLAAGLTAVREALDALRTRGPVRTVARVAGILLVAVSLAALAWNEWQVLSASRAFDDIRTQVPTQAADHFLSATPGAAVSPAVTDAPWETLLSATTRITSDGVLPQYVALYRRNPQLAGWLRFPGLAGFAVDYPVMFSGDNAYYLRRDFAKRYSSPGCLFFDGTDDPAGLDRNLVVYGHAMRSKTMFGPVESYVSSPAEWSTAHTVFVDLLWTRLEYEIFSIYTVPLTADYRRTSFADAADFGEYVAALASRSIHDFGVAVGPNDRILTLSTCDNDDHGKRVVVHAKLVRQIVFDRMDVSSADYVLPGDLTGAAVPTTLPRDNPTR